MSMAFIPLARTGLAWWPWLAWQDVLRTEVPCCACAAAEVQHDRRLMRGHRQEVVSTFSKAGGRLHLNQIRPSWSGQTFRPLWASILTAGQMT